MLLNVRIAGRLPAGIATVGDFLAIDRVFIYLTRPFSADQGFGDVPFRAMDLAGHAEHMHAAWVFEIDREKVEDVAVHLRIPIGPDAATHADRADGVLFRGPIDDVEIVHV